MSNILKAAEDGLAETNKILNRIKELSLKSADETEGNKDRKKIEEEYNALLKELDKVAKNTKNTLGQNFTHASEKLSSKPMKIFDNKPHRRHINLLA